MLACVFLQPIYGLSESGPVSFMGKSSDTFDQWTLTTGSIMHNTEAKVVDKNGSVVPRGEKGELWVRGHQMLEYWDDLDKTRDMITLTGWLKTG